MGLSEKERIRVLQCVGVCERERGDAKNEENRCMKKSSNISSRTHEQYFNEMMRWKEKK